MLARMAKRGWLRAAEPKRSKAARVYRLTPRGHEVLDRLLDSLDELYREVGAHRPVPHPSERVRGASTAAQDPKPRATARTTAASDKP